MIDIKSIKLVVWDLDDTFWKGTISEGAIIPEQRNIQLVSDLTDCGIVNAVCSKNDFEVAKDALEKQNAWQYFVFSSINWENKAIRLKNMIDKMALRPVNVLFIDDNTFNLQEARHYVPDIQTAEPDVIDELVRQVVDLPRTDIKHKRLQQYRVLEEKCKDQDKYSSNEDFLFASDIRVDIKEDCLSEIDRIHELILRSNQLNFTKKRDSVEELQFLLRNPDCKSGYVTVRDKYGDYGIVGFYALVGNKLEHFVFSCRTMGQGIEQYVYAQLGFPEIEVVGEVRSQLNKTEIPLYINQKNIGGNESKNEKNGKSCSILLKGPCDLSHSQMYLGNSECVDTEFTYVKAGSNQIIDAYNHSVHIAGLKLYSEDEKKQIAEDCVFVDPDMLSGSFYEKQYDVIFLSSLIESVYGVYRKKGTHIRVVFGGRNHPLTDKSCWKQYISGEFYNGGNAFSEEYLERFAEKYEFEGAVSPQQYVDFLDQSLKWLAPETVLCVILGSTYPYPNAEEHAAYHKELNEAVKDYAKNSDRLRVIEIDSLIGGENDFNGGIDHFTAKVYYALAMEMSKVIEEVTHVKIKHASSIKVHWVEMLQPLRKLFGGALKKDGKLYLVLKKVYLKATGKKDRNK